MAVMSARAFSKSLMRASRLCIAKHTLNAAERKPCSGTRAHLRFGARCPRRRHTQRSKPRIAPTADGRVENDGHWGQIPAKMRHLRGPRPLGIVKRTNRLHPARGGENALIE